MLTRALEQVQRRGAIGCEIHVAHADGVSEFQTWNMAGVGEAEAGLFAAAPVGGAQ
ncbi:MAG: hypothetical protein RL756_1741 [Pseudomonadota bacterium]|jgi:hypothetical protein